MQQVTATMPSLPSRHQPNPAGPFRTPVRDIPPIGHPAPSSVTKRVPPSAILIGESGANLVLSRLQGWGIPTQQAMPGVAYDLIADVPGHDMLRIQVKTKSKPKGQRCSFAMTRGYYYSLAGMFRYDKDDYDIAAFVCLSVGQVFFCAGPIHRIVVRATWLRSSNIDRETFQLALQTIRHRRNAAALSWLASMTSDDPTPDIQPALPPQNAPALQASLNFCAGV